MSTTYSVVIDLKTVGSLDLGKGAGGKGPEKAMSLMKSGWNDLRSAGSDVMGVLDGAVEKMASFAKWGAIAAGAAGAGAIVYGVKDLNNELESTKISLGTIFAANGIAADVPRGMSMASNLVKEMRKDARALPGEFEDLKNVFTTGAIDAFRAGATPEQWEKVSAKVMASAKVAQVPMEVASREFAQLLEGRAGAHNVLGTRLFGLTGASAKKFNSEDDATRYAELSKTLDKYSGSINEFGQSFDGLSSSLVDNGKNLLRQATEPLFNVIKHELTGVNAWFDNNENQIEIWSDRIGEDLVDAFQSGKNEILLWEPAVESFATNAYHKLQEIWVDIGPTVGKIGEEIREALKDPGTIDKIIHMLELWIALKGVGSLAGGGALAAGAGIAAGGNMVGAAKGGMGGALIKQGSDIAGGATAGWKIGGVPGALVGGALGSVAGAYDQYRDYKGTKDAGVKQAQQAAFKFGETLWNDIEEMNAHSEVQQSFSDSVNNWANKMEASGNSQEASLLRLYESTIAASGALDGLAGASYAEMKTKDIGEMADKSLALGNIKLLNALYGPANAQQKKTAPAVGGGHGGTSIQKVEIVVTSNQNPSRVARMVFDEMGKLARNPRASRFTPNYASLTPGT